MAWGQICWVKGIAGAKSRMHEGSWKVVPGGCWLLSYGQGDYEGGTGEARTIKKIADVKENPHDLKNTSGLCLCRFIDILNITAKELLKAYHFL